MTHFKTINWLGTQNKYREFFLLSFAVHLLNHGEAFAKILENTKYRLIWYTQNEYVFIKCFLNNKKMLCVYRNILCGGFTLIF